MKERIVIAWPGFTGYTGGPFRALAALCELKVYIEPSRYEQHFDAQTLAGVDFRRVEAAACGAVVGEIRAFAPDLVLIANWSTPLARLLAKTPLPGRKVLAFDMPWEWTPRKILARWALRPLLRHFDRVFVPGRRSARYARYLGFDASHIVTRANSSGFERFPERSPEEIRAAEGFLFVGRFSSEKGLDLLLKAYARYRQGAAHPWPLDLVGSGERLPSDRPEGVRVLGFVPPPEMPRVLAAHACLVLPSRWEPWGVCVAEAMSAGLLTVVSEACGIVDDLAPTRRVATGDIRALAAALAEVAAQPPEARVREAARARRAAAGYSARVWAERVRGMVTPHAEIREATPADYGEVARLMRALGLSCSTAYLERFLPQGLVATKGAEIIGFCGYVPARVWVEREERPALQLGMLGMRAGQGLALKRLIGRILEKAQGNLVYANSTNHAGHRAWTRLGGFSEGPDFCGRIQWTFASPRGLFSSPRLEAVDPASERWRSFVRALRAANRGVMTARDPEAWRRLFGRVLTVERAGRLAGLVAVRRRLYRGLVPRCEIMDIVALGNDRAILEELVEKARRYAAHVFAPVLEFVGPPLLAHTRAAVANLCVYRANASGLGPEAFARGWFFGPMDGDRARFA